MIYAEYHRVDGEVTYHKMADVASNILLSPNFVLESEHVAVLNAIQVVQLGRKKRARVIRLSQSGCRQYFDDIGSLLESYPRDKFHFQLVFETEHVVMDSSLRDEFENLATNGRILSFQFLAALNAS
jgi:hypothetical protein